MTSTNRREFLKHTGQTAAAVTIAASCAKSAQNAEPKATSANERPVVAVIGTGGMGMAHVRQLAANREVRLAYVCDVDERRSQDAAKTAESAGAAVPVVEKDLRRVLDDQAVDAVWIATPDHWHAPATILACQAGKHVYVEKPCAHNLREGRLMIEAARRNQRVVQVGTQSRSTEHVRQAVERIRAGAIGEVLVAKAWNSQRRRSIGHAQPSEPPAQLDYDLWLGPAPFVPYQANLLPGIWRWWHAFGTGDMGNDGVHDLDIARWGLGVETHPSRIAALGGKSFFDDDQQFPDTKYVIFEYGTAAAGRAKQLI
jgi:predicted dehydrogenase